MASFANREKNRKKIKTNFLSFPSYAVDSFIDVASFLLQVNKGMLKEGTDMLVTV